MQRAAVAEKHGMLDRLFGACLSLLIAAAAVYIAVHLIEAVWSALLVILVVGGIVAVSIAIMRGRSERW